MPMERRSTDRTTLAQRAVTVARIIVTIPGRIGRAGVTMLAWYGAYYIVQASLKPLDKWGVALGLLPFLFGCAFAFPERTVATLKVVADAWDAVKRGRQGPGGP